MIKTENFINLNLLIKEMFSSHTLEILDEVCEFLHTFEKLGAGLGLVGRDHFWLALPCVYLGFLEGFVHTASMKIFKLKRSYTPGMVTALCQLAFSTVMMVIIVRDNLVEPWQYPVAFLALVVLFVCAQSQVAATNGLEYRKMPGMIRANIKAVRNK